MEAKTRLQLNIFIMKVCLVLLLILSYFYSPSQEIPFFEQIAFNYFQHDIYPKTGIKKNIYVSTVLHSFNTPGSFNWPSCLEKYETDDKASLNISGKREITIPGNTPFKKKTATSRRKIKCYVVESLDTPDGHHLVNVALVYNYQGDVYHIELDNTGKPLRWCKGGWVE